MGRRRCCCTGIVVTLRVEACGGVRLASASIVVKTLGGTIVATATTPTTPSPYAVAVTIPAAGSYVVSATQGSCITGGSATIAMTAGGSYLLTIPCNPVSDRIGITTGCFYSIGSLIYTPTNATMQAIVGGYKLYQPTGPSPTITITHPGGKLDPAIVYGADPDCAQQTYTTSMPLASGWGCDCFVNDKIGRLSVLAVSSWGTATVSGTIGSGTATFTTSAGSVYQGMGAPISCGGGITRTEPIVGTASITIALSWNLCGGTPVATMSISHVASPVNWYNNCPLTLGNLRCQYLRIPSGGTLVDFGADSYSIGSTSTPASVTFNWIPTAGAYQEEAALSGCTEIGSALGGSLTITEIP